MFKNPFILFILLTGLACKPGKNEFEKAKSLTDKGEYKEALVVLDKLLEEQPNFDSAYLERAYVHNMLQDYRKSLQDYNHILPNPQLRLSVLEGRAWLHIDFGKYDKAMEDFDHIIRLDKQYFSAYTGRGYTRTINKIYGTDPNHLRPYQDKDEKGYYYFDYPGAIADFNRSIDINKSYAEAYIERGKIYAHLDSNIQALKDYNEAVSLDSNNFDAVYNRALLLMNYGTEHYALKDFDKAIQLNPEYALIYANRAILYQRYHNKEKACEDYKRMEELGYKMTEEQRNYCY